MSVNLLCFMTCSGFYVSIDNKGGVVAKEKRLTTRRGVFEIRPMSSGVLGILCVENGMYLSADKGGGGRASFSKNSVDGWEQFRLVEVQDAPGQFHIIASSKGHYLSADRGGGGSVACNKQKAGDWERFVLVPAPRHLGGSSNLLDLATTPVQQQFAAPQQYGQPMQQQQQQMFMNQGYPNQQMPPQQMGYQNAPPVPMHPQQQQQQPSPQLPRAKPAPPVMPPKPKQKSGSRTSSRSSSSSRVDLVDDDLISYSKSDSKDLSKAKESLQSYLKRVSELEDIFAEVLRPGIGTKSKSKLFTLGTIATGNRSNALKLDRETKAEISDLAEPILRQFDMFLFDWNKYGKKLGERSFSKIALVLGSFKDHLKQMCGQSVKSDTITGTLSRLSSKFEKISVNFDQSFDYNNSGSVQADFEANDTIEGQADNNYEFQDDDRSDSGDDEY